MAARASLLVRVVPLPWMRVLTVRLLPGVAFGMVTFGVLSNAPVAVTAVFAPAERAEADGMTTRKRSTSTTRHSAARTRQASRGDGDER